MEEETQKIIKEEEHKRKPKSAFTEKEDQLLISLVDEHGNKDWITISKSMGTRTPRQCRERYNNYLRPDIENSEWTDDEDTLLIKLYMRFGPKWASIAQKFPNRTPNNIKNRYKKYQRHLKRHSRKVNPKDNFDDHFVINYMKCIDDERQQNSQDAHIVSQNLE